MIFFPSAKRFFPFISLICLALISLAGFWCYMQRAYPNTAFMDSLRFLVYFDYNESGNIPLWLTWNQGAHHGLFPQLFVYLNAKLFGYRIFAACLSSGPVIAANAVILGVQQLKSLRTSSLPIRWTTILITFLVLFSLANWEIYTLDVGPTIFAKNLAFFVYWVCLDKFLFANELKYTDRFLSWIAGPIIIIFIAFGWAYAFTIATLLTLWIQHISRKIKPDRIKIILTSLLSSILIYIAGGFIFPEILVPFGPKGESSLMNMAIGYFMAAFSGLLGSETISAIGIPIWIQIVSASLIIGCGLFILVNSIRTKVAIPFVPSVLFFYSTIQCAAVAFARGRFNIEWAAAPRYFVDCSLLGISTLWLLAIYSARMKGNHRAAYVVSRSALILLAFFLVKGQMLTARDEWKKAPFRKAGFARMQKITLAEKHLSETEAAFLQCPPEIAIVGIYVQKKYHLGPFLK